MTACPWPPLLHPEKAKELDMLVDAILESMETPSIRVIKRSAQNCADLFVSPVLHHGDSSCRCAAKALKLEREAAEVNPFVCHHLIGEVDLFQKPHFL